MRVDPGNVQAWRGDRDEGECFHRSRTGVLAGQCQLAAAPINGGIVGTQPVDTQDDRIGSKSGNVQLELELGVLHKSCSRAGMGDGTRSDGSAVDDIERDGLVLC